MQIRVEIENGPALLEIAAKAARPENVVRPHGREMPFDGAATVAIECQINHPNLGAFHQRIGVVFLIVAMPEGEHVRAGSFCLLGGRDGLGLDTAVEGGRLRSRGMPAPSAVEAICSVLGYVGGLEECSVFFSNPEEPRPQVVVMQEIDAAPPVGEA